MKKNQYLCTRFANIYPYYNKKFINFMEKIFTLLRGKQLMVFIMTALLIGAVETAKADYSITGIEIFNSDDWSYDSGRWSDYAPGMYDNYLTDPTTTTDLISPKIEVSDTKTRQRLTVSGYKGGNYSSILYFYVSYDGNTWEEVGNMSSELNSTMYPTIENLTVEFEAKGNYYVKLTVRGIFIANFKVEEYERFYEGFDYSDGIITDSNKPDGWTMDKPHEGASGYFGTVQYYNKSIFYYLIDGYDKPGYAITPKLYVSSPDEKMTFKAYTTGTGELKIYYSDNIDNNWKQVYYSGTIGSGSFKDLSIKGIPEGNWFIKFEMNNACIDEVNGFTRDLHTLSLNQTEESKIEDGINDVIVNYTISAQKWGTIVLPFAIDVKELGDLKAYKFTGYNDGNINIQTVSSLEAGQPYIIYANEAITEDIVLNNVKVTASKPVTMEFNEAKFVPTYAPMAAGTMTGKYGVVPSTGKIQKGGANATMKGFRAYFELPAGTNGARMIIDGEDVTAIISIITDAENGNAIYNLNGQRVKAATKGVYIINGKKMIIK